GRRKKTKTVQPRPHKKGGKKMKSEILTTLNADELAELVAVKVLALLAQQAPPPVHDGNGYLSRQQVAEQYHITLKTLGQWTKRGTVKAYRIGRRVLYKPSEVAAALTAINTGDKKTGR